MDWKDHSLQSPQADEPAPSADARLFERIRAGDPEAGAKLVRAYYPGVYRYLLYLTGSADVAEDLTQETFLQAWRHLATFEGRATLRTWLHRIAHREFLQAMRTRKRALAEQRVVPLEEAGEIPEARATGLTETVELHAILGKLPIEEREIVVLHYLEGYELAETAQILGIPVRRVRQRLSEARGRLQQALGEGDLAYLNEPGVPMRQWAWLPLRQMYALERRWRLAGGVPPPEENAMERREFLRQAAVGAAGMMLPEAEKDVVDSRLTQKVTLAFKGMALIDLCEQMHKETGVHLTAGASVADEKVTLFCEKTPLREVMRQLSRPFGYTWARAGKSGAYRYELVQDLRSQLLEEELRNRDRNEALIALDEEIKRYQPFLHLSPDEALARSKTAPPTQKKLLENLAATGWGAIQIYFRLSPRDLEALRAGQSLSFKQEPKPGEQLLPSDLVSGVLHSVRQWRMIKGEKGYEVAQDPTDPRSVEVAAVPGLRAQIKVGMRQSELGQFTFTGSAGFDNPEAGESLGTDSTGPLAIGKSSTAFQPNEGVTNAGLARETALRRTVTLQPEPSYRPAPAPAQPAGGAEGSAPEPMVTSADVLEALHRATGMPIVADYYTRLYLLSALSVRSLPLFEALNRLADTMHLRWTRDSSGDWLQFRSVSFFNDRVKEVPNRLLSRWAAARRQSGTLRLDDLTEIAGLSDTQLDAATMAEGARLLFGLAEWNLARNTFVRPHLRYLAGFTPEQRQEAMSAAGLPFTKMPLSQQQQFINVLLQGSDSPLQSLEQVAGGTLRVEYTQPGWFQWGDPAAQGYTRWVVPPEPGSQNMHVIRPLVRERTREAAVAALRRVDPKIRAALLHWMRRADPRLEAAPPSDEAQIFPTQRYLFFVYIPSDAKAWGIRVFEPNGAWGYGAPE